MIKTRFFLIVSLFFVSFTAYAIEMRYTLINGSASPIPNPIQVTAGKIDYYFLSKMTGPIPSKCPLLDKPVEASLGSVVPLPLSIYLGTGSKFTLTIPSDLDDCFINAYAVIEFTITQVNGLSKQDGTCITSTNLFSNYSNSNIKIEKTTDSFYCSSVQ